MKNRTTILNSVLAAVLAVVLCASIVVKAVSPHFIIPGLNIPAMAAISLAALVLTNFVKTEEGCFVCEDILAAVTFGLLPWLAGTVTGAEALKYALAGLVVFGILNELFKSMVKRMNLAGMRKGAAIPAAFALYLACRSFTGWIL